MPQIEKQRPLAAVAGELGVAPEPTVRIPQYIGKQKGNNPGSGTGYPNTFCASGNRCKPTKEWILKVSAAAQPHGSQDRFFRVLEFDPKAADFTDKDFNQEAREALKPFRIGQELESDPGSTTDAEIDDAKDKHHNLRFAEGSKIRGAYVTSFKEMKKGP